MDPNETIKLFQTESFNPDRYVKDLSQNCIGVQELVLVRKKVHSLLEATNDNLKKNVYQNYMQFIDTAKEISHLESEMYQLSHLLTEQKSLLGHLFNTSVLGDDGNVTFSQNKGNDIEGSEQLTEKQRDESRQSEIATVLEKVEGSAAYLQAENITLLHKGYLSELDINENTPLRSVYGFLFSEGLLLAVTNSGIGAKRYKCDAYFELGSMAVVNVRDLGNVKYAFKVLAFPDTRLFQCKTSTDKKNWLEKFDYAKKQRLARENLDGLTKHAEESKPEEQIERNDFKKSEVKPEIVHIEHPEWLMDVSEELDVCIAQRHFEEALQILEKAKSYISQIKQTDPVLADIQRKVEQKNSYLTEILMKELEVTPDKSLQGGLRAARRAVRLLNQLGYTAQCCELFLKLCSSTLKTQCKRVKREGSINVYIKHLTSVVFTNLSHMTEEFLRAFPDTPTCLSAYVVWASNELQSFINHFTKQVFVPQTSLTIITECVVTVKDNCEKLCKYGIDLCYQLDGALRSPLTRALRELESKLIEAIKLRFSEEKWIPLNLKTKLATARFLQENKDIGLSLDTYVTGDCWIQLSTSTVSFTKLFITMLDDCLKLHNADLLYTIDDILYKVFDTQLRYTQQSLSQESQAEHKKFIVRNVEFLFGQFMDIVQYKYVTTLGFECEKVKNLKQDYSAMMQGISPTKRSIYRSTEYL